MATHGLTCSSAHPSHALAHMPNRRQSTLRRALHPHFSTPRRNLLDRFSDKFEVSGTCAELLPGWRISCWSSQAVLLTSVPLSPYATQRDIGSRAAYATYFTHIRFAMTETQACSDHLTRKLGSLSGKHRSTPTKQTAAGTTSVSFKLLYESGRIACGSIVCVQMRGLH